MHLRQVGTRVANRGLSNAIPQAVTATSSPDVPSPSTRHHSSPKATQRARLFFRGLCRAERAAALG